MQPWCPHTHKADESLNWAEIQSRGEKKMTKIRGPALDWELAQLEEPCYTRGHVKDTETGDDLQGRHQSFLCWQEPAYATRTGSVFNLATMYQKTVTNDL